MGLVKEFKAFAMRGNVVDMAVGVVIGAAFGKIVTSMVNDIIMPLVGSLVGNMDLSNLKVIVQQASVDAAGTEIPAISVNYGNFLQMVLDFLIVAFCIFMVIRAMNSMKKKEEEKPAAPPAPSNEEVLLGDILTELRKQNEQ